jgi:tRNA(Ile2)-agmatinylcytidine synthase
MHIGLDDTDSIKNGCTTYLAALLIEKLLQIPVQFIDYPALIRLNPNIPWKTRGNAALCLRFQHQTQLTNNIKQSVLSIWERHSQINNKKTNPGIVFYQNRIIPKELTTFSHQTETGIVTLNQAVKLIRKIGVEALGYNNCRGIIGALAAIGETLTNDYTYELIAYRIPKNWGTKRLVDRESIFNMDQILQPYVFNNIDKEKKRVLITPRGPDPILFGIRGETANIVKQALELVKPLEPIERWVIFRSNQGTDAHLTCVNSINELEHGRSVILNGIVSSNPKIVPVRHVIFSIKDSTGEIDCAAYEPTGELRRIAQELVVGDCIEAAGAVCKATKTKSLTINLEKIKVLFLNQKILQQNPLCTTCQKRLKSMGKHQGFRCEKCSKKFPYLKKQDTILPRTLKLGLYITSTHSQRHLTKPKRRFGQEKHGEPAMFVEEWCSYV